MFLLAVDVKAQQHHSNVIPLGSWLSPIANRTSWLSPSGLFAFAFYPQGRKGFAIGIWMHTQPKNTIVWTANPDDPPVSSKATLNLTSDGMLLLCTEQGGQNLSNGDELVSRSDHSSRRYCLQMKTNGNLVSSPVNSTDGSENAYCSSLVILANNSYPGKKETSTIIYRAILDSDGIFKLYSHHFWGNCNTISNVSLEWSSLHDTWTAKISDFRLARLSVPNQTRISMGLEGTSEFSAPEWQKNSPISVKADIYSFGVLLLEILDKLVEDENVDMKTLERMVKVGLWCIQEDPALRPPMKNAREDRVHVAVLEEHGWVFVWIYDGFHSPDAPDYLLSNLCSFVHKELKGLLWDEGFESATTTMIDNTTVGGAVAAMGLFMFTFTGGT
uniref:Bulb-type lectin domain-containing protein n=1 Tax=Quercus lobata TaxID=97700 RepID=A0A7N2MLW3_QUELO